MKSLKTTLAILTITFLLISCSKDESPDTASQNKDLVFENLNSVTIPEKFDILNPFPPLPANSEINVTTTGTLKDLSKFTLEMNIEHGRQSDLQFELVAPDGTAKTFIFRRGLDGRYLANQKLRFNTTFTALLPNEGDDFMAGNYKECVGDLNSQAPSIPPIFQFLQNKNINGVWILRATDWEVSNSGSIKSWRLVFDEGALQ